ncbi:ADP-ribosylation factor-like protein 2-binding protein isoform X3 [Cinclus cinclus]
MDDDFQLIQRNFLEKHYQEFDDSEENKLIYTDIFNEYMPSKKCAALCLRAGVRTEPSTPTEDLQLCPLRIMQSVKKVSVQHKDEMPGDIFDLLLTFTDFLAFKEMFLEYRAEKEGRSLDLSSALVVTSLNH